MSSGKVILGAIAGLATGAILGILFAPEKGSTTRRKIKDKFNQGKEEFSDKYEEIIDALKGKVTKVEQQFEESLDDLVASGREKTEDVIVALEAKLAALKKEVSKK